VIGAVANDGRAMGTVANDGRATTAANDGRANDGMLAFLGAVVNDGSLGAGARTQWRVVGGSSFLINY
jgi:hypothetical protein